LSKSYASFSGSSGLSNVPSNYAIGFLFNTNSTYYKNLLNTEKNVLLLVNSLDKTLSKFTDKKTHSKSKIDSSIRSFVRSLENIPTSAGLKNSIQSSCNRIHRNVLDRFFSYPGYHNANPKDPDRYGWYRIEEVLKDRALMIEVSSVGNNQMSGYFAGIGNLDVLERNTSKIFRDHRWWKFQNRYPGYESDFEGRGSLVGWWEFQESLNSLVNRQFLINHDTGEPYQSDYEEFKRGISTYVKGRIAKITENARAKLR
jgi:hypothetical protein